MKIYSDSSGPPGSLYLPEKNFSAEAISEARKYLLGEQGYLLRPWGEDIKVGEIADLKEEAIRKHFSFISAAEMERLVAWHRKKAERLLPETFLALRHGELAGIGSLEEIDSNHGLISSGYSRRRAAVAALTALRISLAEQRGYQVLDAEIFRLNQLGRAHILRWGFEPTGESRSSNTSDKRIDLWRKELRTNRN